MSRIRASFAALLCIIAAIGANAQWLPANANVRFTEQISNGLAGNCRCFELEGGAVDASWKIAGLPGMSLGMAVDLGWYIPEM